MNLDELSEGGQSEEMGVTSPLSIRVDDIDTKSARRYGARKDAIFNRSDSLNKYASRVNPAK